MADTPDIKVRFGAEGTDAVVAAIRTLTQSLDNLKNRQEENAKATGSLKGAFQALLSLAFAEKLLQWEKSTIASVLAIGKLEQVSGMTAKTLSVLSFAASRSGVDTDTLSKIVAKGARSITEFQGGAGKAAMAFQLLHIRAKDFANLAPDQKFLKVASAVAGMQNGFNKATVVQEIFGRGAATMIPLLNKLSDEGFRNLTEQAQRFGLIIDQEAIEATKRARASLFDLRDAAKGAAIQFNNGLLPALADVGDALTNATSSGKISGFRTMGEVVGNVAKFIAEGFLAIGKIVGAVLATIQAEVATFWSELKGGAGGVWSAMGEALQGNFANAARILKAGNAEINSIEEDENVRLTAIWKGLGEQLQKLDDDLFGKKKARTNDGGTPPPEVAPPDDSATKARLAALRAMLENELALWKASAADRAEADKVEWAKGLVGLRTYFANRRNAIEDERDKEIATLQGERKIEASTPARTDADAIAKAQRLADFDAKIAREKIQAGTKLQALDLELYEAELAGQKRVLEYQNVIAEVQGRTYDAAIAKILQESEAIRIALVQAGLSPDQVNALVSELNAAKTLTAKWDQDRRESSLAMGDLDLARGTVENEIASGKLLEVERDREIARIEAERVPNLEKIASHMREVAESTGDPAKIQDAERFSQEVDKIAIASDYAHQQWVKFGNGVAQEIQGDLANFLESGIDKVKGLGDAFRSLALIGVNALRKIAAQMLAQIIMEKAIHALRKMFGGGGDDDDGGAQKVAVATAAGLAQAAPLIVASGMMATAGGVITAASITLGVSAAALQAAATMLLAANSVGGGLGLASGGYVAGPGTATSDSIPARLSNGEFVVRAAAVQAIGVPMLAAINRGLSIPSIVSASSIPRFASGGLVRADTAAGQGSIRMHVGLERGLVLQELRSKGAGQIVVEHAQRNAKALNRAIGRG